jgi:hypothetical protein
VDVPAGEWLEHAGRAGGVGHRARGLRIIAIRQEHHLRKQVGSPPLQPPVEARAIQLGPPEIAQDEIVGPPVNPGERHQPVGRHVHLVAISCEHGGQNPDGTGIVVHDEDSYTADRRCASGSLVLLTR